MPSKGYVRHVRSIVQEVSDRVLRIRQPVAEQLQETNSGLELDALFSMGMLEKKLN